MRVPSDMRRFEPKKIVLQAEIEVTDSTAALVRGQYCHAKVWITIGAGNFISAGGVPQTYGFQDVLMHRSRKMSVQNAMSGKLNLARIGGQQPVKRFG